MSRKRKAPFVAVVVVDFPSVVAWPPVVVGGGGSGGGVGVTLCCDIPDAAVDEDDTAVSGGT